MWYRNLASLVVALVLVGLHARGDEVWVKDKDKSIKGEVKLESAKEVHVLTTKEKVVLPGAEVIDIQYSSIKPLDLNLSGGAYLVAKSAEKEANDGKDAAKRKAALKKAIDNYRDTIRIMKGDINASRHFKYKIALLTLQQANNEGFPTDKALGELQTIKPLLTNSWQINHIMPLIAQLQMANSDFKGAEQTFQEMSEMEGLPDDVRQNAELMTVQVAVNSGSVEQATKKLELLAKKAGKNPVLASRIQMARAEILVKQKKLDEAVPLLNQLIKDNSDRQIKALAHNTLGECLFNANRHNEALWEFLWVDTVYNQDKSQRAKALYFLWKTFEQLNNAERAQECRETLLSDAQLAGTEYQRLAASKSK